MTASLSLPVHETLAAACLHGAPRGLLLLDAPPPLIACVAALVACALEQVHGHEVEVASLPPYAGDTTLWGTGTHGALAGAGLRDAGALLGARGRERWRVLVVEDLDRLETAVGRALLQVAGESLCTIERHGESVRVPTRQLVVAQVASTAAGRVSAHLLDRFGLRLPGPWHGVGEDRVAHLTEWLAGEGEPAAPALHPSVLERLRAARGAAPPLLDPAAIALAARLVGEAAGHRRALDLARLAVGLARLRNVPADERCVREAAAVTGLAGADGHDAGAPHTEPATSTDGSDTAPPPDRAASVPGDPADPADAPAPPEDDRVPRDAPRRDVVPRDVVPAEPVRVRVAEPLEPPPLPSATVAAAIGFPEDQALQDRADQQLQLPFGARRGPRDERGPIIGTRPYRPGAPLAAVPTVIAAMPFQASRRRHRPGAGRRLILHPMDLRAWRRAALASHLLVVVLDLTALRDRAWSTALAPYIARAYVDRAPVCLVLVGASDAPDELGAQRILARSVLTPALRRGLNAGGGRASPLAHGLHLVHETVADLKRRRDTGRQVRLVVASDGRGNVPLAASLLGHVEMPVGRRGVEDALAEARRLAALGSIEAVLLDPRPDHAPGMTRDLARALGARTEPMAQRTGRR